MCKFRPFKKKLINENLKTKNQKQFKESAITDEKQSANEQISNKKVLSENASGKIEKSDTIQSSEKVLKGIEPLQLTNDDAPPEYDFVEDSLEDIYIKSKVNLNDLDFSQNDLPAKRLWGILTVKLREKNYVTLHTACGEIRDVSREGNLIKAVVYEEYLYNILTKQDNFDKILFELREINDKISLEFELKRVGKNKTKNNLQLLKNLFGDLGVE